MDLLGTGTLYLLSAGDGCIASHLDLDWSCACFGFFECDINGNVDVPTLSINFKGTCVYFFSMVPSLCLCCENVS
jgi:hypothetical protein